MTAKNIKDEDKKLLSLLVIQPFLLLFCISVLTGCIINLVVFMYERQESVIEAAGSNIKAKELLFFLLSIHIFFLFSVFILTWCIVNLVMNEERYIRAWNKEPSLRLLAILKPKSYFLLILILKRVSCLLEYRTPTRLYKNTFSCTNQLTF